jgi:hypothetical protein
MCIRKRQFLKYPSALPVPPREESHCHIGPIYSGLLKGVVGSKRLFQPVDMRVMVTDMTIAELPMLVCYLAARTEQGILAKERKNEAVLMYRIWFLPRLYLFRALLDTVE